MNAQDDRYLPVVHGELVKHAHYVLSYNEPYEQAEWVAWELLSTELNGHESRSNSFYPDPLVSTGSASPNDYKGSGFDRGHLAPAADFSFSEEAMKESFYMSNMSPQNPGLNRGLWKKLEEECRELALKYGSIYQVSGPIFTSDSTSKLKSGVAIPNGYFRIVIYPADQPIDTLVYVMPNRKISGKTSDYLIQPAFEWLFTEKLWGRKEEVHLNP